MVMIRGRVHPALDRLKHSGLLRIRNQGDGRFGAQSVVIRFVLWYEEVCVCIQNWCMHKMKQVRRTGFTHYKENFLIQGCSHSTLRGREIGIVGVRVRVRVGREVVIMSIVRVMSGVCMYAHK